MIHGDRRTLRGFNYWLPRVSAADWSGPGEPFGQLSFDIITFELMLIDHSQALSRYERNAVDIVPTVAKVFLRDTIASFGSSKEAYKEKILMFFTLLRGYEVCDQDTALFRSLLIGVRFFLTHASIRPIQSTPWTA